MTNSMQVTRGIVAAMAFVAVGAAGWMARGHAQPVGVDPQAEKLLKASTAFLASQKRFSVDTRNTIEVVLASGQKLRFGTASPAGGPLPVGTVVTALPAGCVSAPISGVEYYLCGGTYYRAAFQGNNLAYFVSKP